VTPWLLFKYVLAAAVSWALVPILITLFVFGLVFGLALLLAWLDKH
jgi:hypothetical protein